MYEKALQEFENAERAFSDFINNIPTEEDITTYEIIKFKKLRKELKEAADRYARLIND